jgi:type IV pilus assembly protein PilW
MNNILNIKQQGLTLIELMIAMALSAVVVLAVGGILISSNQAASVSNTLSDSQETGRFAVEYMNRQILKAGYNPEDSDMQRFPSLCNNPADTICIRNSNEGTGDPGDRLAIRRLAEDNTDTHFTCYGSALTVAGDVIVTDVYWVEVINNISSLRCQTFDANGNNLGLAQSLAAGVITMQVLYGQSFSDPVDEVLNVSRYYNADQVPSWDDVYSVRVAFLTQALTTTSAPPWQQNFTLFDTKLFSFNDSISRQVFTNTITLMN